MTRRRFDGQVAIVTGGGQGLGQLYAEGLAAEGAAVVIAEINAERGAAVAASINESGGRAHFVQTDVSNRASCDRMAKEAVDVFGGIDILLNNAAIYDGLRARGITEVGEEEWDRVMAVNVKGIWHATSAALPALQASSQAVVVNIASVTALVGAWTVLHYSASKGAVIALTRALAKELGPQGIRVTGCAPGMTMTEATRGLAPDPTMRAARSSTQAIQREMEPEDIVPLVLFLCSGDAGMIAGQNYVIDGGFAMP